MKTKCFTLYLILLLFLGCKKTDEKSNFFDINDVDLLEITNITEFWGDNSVIEKLFLNGIYQYNDSNLIGEIRCFSEDCRKDIGIRVYNSTGNAQDAMSNMIQSVACIINKGNSNEINEDWWYSECKPNCVFVYKWNTIIMIAYGINDFSMVKDTLFNTANELIYRIEKTKQ